MRLIERLARRFGAPAQRPSSFALNFDEVYRNNLFEGEESISGKGSSLEQTIVLRRKLPALLRDLEVETLLDIPCGDFHWMQHLELGETNYIGGDIVEALVLENQRKHANARRSFLHVDLISGELPIADAIFCRDCLVHLNLRQAVAAIENVKRSGASYFLTTTFANRAENADLNAGIWRPLNLQRSPFDFPEPLRLIDEGCTEDGGIYADKCIGVWRVSDL